jgi:hypothetical protein
MGMQMAANDQIYPAVKAALIKDGWAIVDDPLTIVYKETTLFADLAAERALAAQRGNERIVVEIKSFLGASLIHDLEQALGQYGLYRTFLKKTEPNSILYMAVGTLTFSTFFQRESIQEAMIDHHVRMLVVDLASEEVTQWIN